MLLSSLTNTKIEAGIDEAGRGPLAGAVFAAAVILPLDYHNDRLNDSKKLSLKTRLELRKEIENDAIAYAVAQVSPERIDAINILNATFEAMNIAVAELKQAPELLLVDGNRFKTALGIPFECIVKGDGKMMSIAAASILAKTYRDEYMQMLHDEFPMYGWDKNAGYPTKLHRAAILEYGVTKYHRITFNGANPDGANPDGANLDGAPLPHSNKTK